MVGVPDKASWSLAFPKDASVTPNTSAECDACALGEAVSVGKRVGTGVENTVSVGVGVASIADVGLACWPDGQLKLSDPLVGSV